jgi:O-antigen ligase
MLRSRKLGVLIVILGIAYLVLNSSFFSSVFEAEEAESGGTRLAAWQTNWLVTREHLFLGTGPAGYAAYYMTYYPDRGMATHNNYLDVVSQTGLLGFAPFMWTLIAGAFCIRTAYRHVPRGGFEHGAVAGVFAAFVGMLVAAGLGDWMLPFPYTQGIAGYDYTIWAWLVIGLVMVMYRLYGSPQNPQA